MDGNCTHVRELTRLAKTHGAVLLQDEAHATLVFGSRGGGLAVGLDIDLHVGTLSKAFDTHGGFVAFTAKLKGLLLAGSRTAIYSTLCPCRSSWLRRWPCALQRIGCTRLWANVAASGAATGIKPASPIMPIVVGSEVNALAMSAALLCDGFLVPVSIPLTVPRGTARQIHAMAAALKRCGALEMAGRAAEVETRQTPPLGKPMTRLLTPRMGTFVRSSLRT